MARRVFFSFCFVVLCSTVPQTLIIGRFVDTALRTWFDNSVSESLQASLEIAGLYATERYRIVRTVADRYLNGLAITDWRSRQVDWMPTIRAMDPEAAACQVYILSADGATGKSAYAPLIETGNMGKFVPRERLDLVRDGFFSLDADGDVVRYGQIVRYSNDVYVCAYASLLPSGFRNRLDEIRRTLGQSQVIDTLDPYLPFMGVWIFAMFCLPSILMVIIIAYLMSLRIVDPVRALQEAAERMAAGDSSFRLIPHTGDELAETAFILNSIADGHSAGKRPDKKAFLRL